jgi:hypothetical protein
MAIGNFKIFPGEDPGPPRYGKVGVKEGRHAQGGIRERGEEGN